MGRGAVDASPRGDPPGFVRVLDDTTLLLPDRPGNNRIDTFRNVVAHPGVGLIFFVPGIEETLRVNGRGRPTTGALEDSSVQGRVPRTGLIIEIDEVFFHCAKALKRSRLWDPAAQVERSSFPSLGRIIADQQADWDGGGGRGADRLGVSGEDVLSDALYDRDALAWSEQQAALLRRLQAGEKVNAALDWANVIEEIESVGRSELHAVEGLLVQALVHLIKVAHEPDAPARRHWLGETVAFLAGAERAYAPSMRHRLDLDRLQRQAVRQMRPTIDAALPEACPYTLDELLDPEADPAVLAAGMVGR